MIRQIWLRIAALLGLAVLPLLALQLNLQKDSITLIYNLAERTGVRTSLDQTLSELREQARERPEQEAEYKDSFFRLSDTKRSLEAFFMAKESIHRDFRLQTVLITLLVLGLCLLGSLALSRGIVKRAQSLIDEREKSAAKLRDLHALENWQNVAKILVHELRAPMTPIKLVATDLSHQYHRLGPEPFASYLKDAQALMNDQVKAIEQMIEGFTTFAKLPNPTFRDGSLSRFLQDFREIYAGSFGQAVRLSVNTLSGDFTYSFDEKLLRDLLFNLCKNAVEANQGVTDIDIRLERGSRVVRIWIQNTGASVPAALRQTLFEPYVSGKSGSNLGLGLAIARKIAFDHGGNLSLASRDEDLGVTFLLELPGEGQRS